MQRGMEAGGARGCVHAGAGSRGRADVRTARHEGSCVRTNAHEMEPQAQVSRGPGTSHAVAIRIPDSERRQQQHGIYDI
jgi:hypothetical protein